MTLAIEPNPTRVVETETKARNSEFFPTLSERQFQQLRDCGAVEESVQAETVLFEEGSIDFDFFAILEGEVDLRQQRDGKWTTLLTERAGEFCGDTHTLSQRASSVTCIARTAARLLRLKIKGLQQLVVERSELSDLLIRSFLGRHAALVKGGLSSVSLLGSRFSPDTHRIRQFLSRNSQPFRWLDLESDSSVAEMLKQLGVAVEETPIVICAAGVVVRNPTEKLLAEHLGLSRICQDALVDVVVIGAGPAGLAATVYAASEGLGVTTLDSGSPGGQAGSSSKIENYLGFPTGISGQDLADRAVLQAQKFGAHLASARTVTKIDCSQAIYTVTMGEQSMRTRSIVIATGATYRKPSAPSLANFEGRGVYYGATPMEESVCGGCPVIVVGGGNSAGQACVFLSGIAAEVHLMIRGKSLSSSMSRYLVRRIEETPNIHLHVETEIEEAFGDEHLRRVRYGCKVSGEVKELDTPAVFLMTGAIPNTDWLCQGIKLDSKGFVLTGRDLTSEQLDAAGWPGGREPYAYETSQPRIFAVGDVRSESTKRVATAVGEGSAMVGFLHKALAELT